MTMQTNLFEHCWTNECETKPKQGMQNPNYSFGWIGGVVSRISRHNEHWDKINTNHKHCAVCGQQKLLNFERLSGGQKSFICNECAERYVEQASKLIQTEPLLNGKEEQ